jgi:hypothetical protein
MHGLDAALACPLSRLDEALGDRLAKCAAGHDFLLQRQHVEELLPAVWNVCRHLLDQVASAGDKNDRAVLAGACAHLMRDVIEPQLRQYPEYRARYDPDGVR